MIPVIQIGNFSLSTYWIMLFTGTIGMTIYAVRVRQDYRLSLLSNILFTTLLTVVGFLGAKILYILENIQHVIENGLSLGGVSFFGSVFLIPVVMPFVGKCFRLNTHTTMDICGPCVAIMIGCMRFGCFLQGCCGGVEACFGEFSFYWPVQAIESIGDFCIFAKLIQLRNDKKYHGLLYPMFMLLYSVMRFLIEFLRDTPKDWFFLSHGQWFAIIAVVISSIWIVWCRRTMWKK